VIGLAARPVRKIRAMKRIGLAILAFSSGPLGLWATLAPRSFYDSFPGGGRHWVRLDGPYNHHLISDFGALNMALCALTIAALILLTREFVLVTGVAWLLYTVPHFTYHATHLDPFGTTDKVLQLAGIGANLVIALALVVTNATDNGRANSS
jgi:hypothetical protein